MSTVHWQPISGMGSLFPVSGTSQERPASLQLLVSQPTTLNPESPAPLFRNVTGPPLRRARSYSPKIWDQMWPKIQQRLDNGIPQSTIVKEISEDEEAICLNFKPTLPQLEGQLRKRRQSGRDSARVGSETSRNPAVPNSEFLLLTDPRSSTSQTSSNPGDHSIVDPPTVGFIFRSQSRQSVEVEYEIKRSGSEDPTPSLTSGTTPRALGEAHSEILGAVCGLYISGSCNTIHSSVMNVEGLDRPDTTSSVTMAGTWGPSLTLPDDTGFQASTLVSLDPIDSDSTSTASAVSKQSSYEALMSDLKWLPVPMQPPRLSEAARGFARLGFEPRRWRTYLQAHPEIFDIHEFDFLNAAQHYLSLDRNGDARNHLDCMNLLWARRLLSEAAWEALLESLIRVHEGQGNETHMEISRTFVRSTNGCLRHLKNFKSNFPNQACCTVTFISKARPPANQEMFDTE